MQVRPEPTLLQSRALFASHPQAKLLSENTPRFSGGKKSTFLFQAGAGAGLLSVVTGLAEFLYAKTYKPPAYQPTKLETTILKNQNSAHKKELAGLAFDGAVGWVKRGLYRAITGDRSPQSLREKQDFKQVKNLLQEAEDVELRSIQAVADASQDETVQQTVQKTVTHFQRSQDEFYDALEIVALTDLKEDKTFKEAVSELKPSAVSSYLMLQYVHHKVVTAFETLSHDDRALLGDVLKQTEAGSDKTPAKETSPAGFDAAKESYRRFVTKVVGKHHPEEVKACVEAGDRLFKLVDENHKAWEIEKAAVALKKQNLTRSAFQFSGVGLLALTICGALAAASVRQKSE